ncbi:MAG: thioredoxin, partial [Chthoniobacterales bacterium]
MVDSWMAFLRCFALFLVLALLCPRDAHCQKFEGRELVTAQLVTETATVVPGQPITAGLLLKMVPGWHTYWQFPGDAGIPTEIKW